MDWLEVHPGSAPLVVSFPHTGTDLPAELEGRYVSPWLARRDADWWVDRLYDFARDLGATTVRTGISRSVIDVNRDPSGASLYPGMATTELCPTTDFDGEPLYRNGQAPDDAEIARRRETYFAPYHAAIRGQLDRLRTRHDKVVLFDAHSIRSRIPRLFEGLLPQFNVGTNDGKSCGAALTRVVRTVCEISKLGHVVDGRFKGGWTTRHYGEPAKGIHAIQLELSCRGYIDEPETPMPHNWPTPYDQARAAGLRKVLKDIIGACLLFAL
ncbi:MAG: N-formylglutamate deformylase [Alphaproteobacteria bacterium]|nr:N-formylglutamate deformylase [Alphaproteobacteria bacterium]